MVDAISAADAINVVLTWKILLGYRSISRQRVQDYILVLLSDNNNYDLTVINNYLVVIRGNI